MEGIRRGRNPSQVFKQSYGRFFYFSNAVVLASTIASVELKWHKNSAQKQILILKWNRGNKWKTAFLWPWSVDKRKAEAANPLNSSCKTTKQKHRHLYKNGDVFALWYRILRNGCICMERLLTVEFVRFRQDFGYVRCEGKTKLFHWFLFCSKPSNIYCNTYDRWSLARPACIHSFDHTEYIEKCRRRIDSQPRP